MPKRPLLLNEQMAQWAELHSYFGLVRQLVDAVPRIDTVKRSTCIEGAWMALARVKTYWAKMKATDIAAQSPPEGKDPNMP